MRLVLFVFAGREENMKVQMPYLHRILDTYPEAELHLWDLTRTRADHQYVRGLEGSHDGRVRVLGHLYDNAPACLYPDGWPDQALGRGLPRGWRRCTCLVHRPPYEKPYEWYAHGTWDWTPDTIYVKIDDDVLFLETDRFADLIDPVIAHPERVVSASVVNNSVCAKHRHDWAETANHFAVGGPRDPKNDKRWWALHERADFARWCHVRFLAGGASYDKPYYVRTRPGEAVSINCIAFSHQTMVKLAGMMSDRLGDEGAVDRLLPWIALSFTAAHLTFGPQDKSMDPKELDAIRDQYATLAKDYLR